MKRVGDADGDADGDGFGRAQGGCNDAEPRQYPGATEYCDGLDNDCDGDIDDGFECHPTCLDFAAVSTSTLVDLPNSYHVKMIWTGSSYAIYGTDTTERVATIRLMEPSGTMAMTRTFVGTESWKARWTGNQFGVLLEPSSAEGTLEFSRVGAAGVELQDPVFLDGFVLGFSIAWSGEEFGVAWSRYDPDGGTGREFVFARFDATGHEIGSRLHLSNVFFAVLDLVWNGAGYGALGRNTGGAGLFLGLDDAGQVVSDPVEMDGYRNATEIQTFWTGSYYGGLIRGPGSGLLRFVRTNLVGEQVGTDIDTDIPPGGSFTWSGSEFVFRRRWRG